MAGFVATQLAIRSIMRVLPSEVAERALAEMEAARRGITHSCESYDLGLIIAAIKADLRVPPCGTAPAADAQQSAPH